MKSAIHILFWALFTLQSISAFLTFQYWNSNALIPFIFFSAAGAWLYRRTTSLLIALLIVIVMIGICEFNAEHIIHYADKATGPSVVLVVVFLISHLRHKHNGVRELNQELDSMVKERDRELSHFSDELLENAEHRRMALGQELHDGIGQQLTGINLLCASLENQLEAEKKSSAQLAFDLSSRASSVHNDIRLIARALFPVRIAHVGLYAALNEMISCYSELHRKPMRVIEVSKFKGMPESLALQLYRVCQECCTFLLEHSSTSVIDITLRTSVVNYIIAITHDSHILEDDGSQSIFDLIQYRIKKAKGTIRFTNSLSSNQSIIYFEVPKPTNSSI